MFAYVQSLGCAPNQADAASIRRALLESGATLADSPENAGIVVVLTCGFTSQMEQQNRLRLAELLSQMQSGAHLLVGGCLPGMTSGQLGLPASTYLFGPRSMSEALFELRTLAGSVTANREQAIDEIETPDARPHLVRIATGCMSQCAFCAIPQAAGRTKSRPIHDIVAEVVALEGRGIRRVLLTAEDASSYGRDIGVTFIPLLHAILDATSRIQIGIDTLNPKWLRDTVDEFAELLQNRRIARTLYVPIESGSDQILRTMGRGYSIADVHRILSKLFALQPHAQIITDFIVGFPGETDFDLEATRAIVRKYPFHFVEVFSYTERAGTAASRMVAPPENVRRQRAELLIADVLAHAAIGERSTNVNQRLLVNTNVDLQELDHAQ